MVFWDRFACDNYNSVILGRSGAGKSYLVKLELLRSLYRGVEGHVIDPEDEYTRLAHAVGGAVVTPGAPGVHLNPFDLPITVRGGRHTARRDALTRRALFLHTFLTVLLGEPLSAIDRAVLDTAITDTYTAAGIRFPPEVRSPTTAPPAHDERDDGSPKAAPGRRPDPRVSAGRIGCAEFLAPTGRSRRRWPPRERRRSSVDTRLG